MNWFRSGLLILSAFSIINGLLHDVFVLAKHKGPYDRSLLRLLMDGHILLTCGAVYLAAWFISPGSWTGAAWLSLIASISLLVYCAMIFPFLRSFGTISLNIVMLILSLIQLFSTPVLKQP